jgi:hypothetical protein
MFDHLVFIGEGGGAVELSHFSYPSYTERKSNGGANIDNGG